MTKSFDRNTTNVKSQPFVKLIMDLFPHDTVRPVQSDLIIQVEEAINTKSHLIAHAPTGLGKTAAALSPALAWAIENKGTVFFLTSRHTQHFLAIDTLKKIKEKHGVNFQVVDLIGKKWMCLQPGANLLSSGDFVEYCKKIREDATCSFYQKLRKPAGGLSMEANAAMQKLELLGPMHTEQFMELSKEEELCPYYLAEQVAKKATVVVADYSLLFNPMIQQRFLDRTGKELSNSIIIVDEGHNLPARMREQLTSRISTIALRNAAKEAAKYGFEHLIPSIKQLQDWFDDQGEVQKLVTKEEFITVVEGLAGVDSISNWVESLETAAITVREEQKQSSSCSLCIYSLSSANVLTIFFNSPKAIKLSNSLATLASNSS